MKVLVYTNTKTLEEVEIPNDLASMSWQQRGQWYRKRGFQAVFPVSKVEVSHEDVPRNGAGRKCASREAEEGGKEAS